MLDRMRARVHDYDPCQPTLSGWYLSLEWKVGILSRLEKNSDAVEENAAVMGEWDTAICESIVHGAFMEMCEELLSQAQRGTFSTLMSQPRPLQVVVKAFLATPKAATSDKSKLLIYFIRFWRKRLVCHWLLLEAFLVNLCVHMASADETAAEMPEEDEVEEEEIEEEAGEAPEEETGDDPRATEVA